MPYGKLLFISFGDISKNLSRGNSLTDDFFPFSIYEWDKKLPGHYAIDFEIEKCYMIEKGAAAHKVVSLLD